MLIKTFKQWELPGIKPTPETIFLNRREVIKALGLGAVAILAGCETQGPEAVKNLLGGFKSESDYKVSNILNNKYKMDRQITNEQKATRFNNFYEFSTKKDDVYLKVDKFRISPWSVVVDGLVNNPMTFDLDNLKNRFTLEERLYRFRCVEAWAMAVPWSGFPLADLIKMVDPKPEATHLRFETFNRPDEAPNQNKKSLPWPYEEGLTIQEAMNELSFISTGMYAKPLEKQNGAPVRLVVPWKYGFKNIKSIVRISFIEKQPGTFWNRLVPDEYGFEANVNPKVPHPRWSQETERLIDTGERIPTLLYNGYAEQVAHLYK